MARAKTLLAAALITAVLSDVSFGQVGPPAPTPPTLWSFLGIPQGMRKVRGALTNRRGNTPRTEPKPPLKALGDPANLESENPAIKKAAEIKQEEDAKPQKIKAIKYLTKIGCGCYDKDGSVSDALVAAAEDCTEDVRLTTMEEIKEAASGNCCSNCGQVCCCNDKILAKLAELAYERDEFGCYVEPSARVREAAVEALCACCPGSPPLEILTEDAEPEEIRVQPETEQESQEVVPEGEEVGTNTFESAPPRLLSKLSTGPRNLTTTGVSMKLSDDLDDQYQEEQAPFTGRQNQPAKRLTEVGQPSIADMRQLMATSRPVSTTISNPDGGVVMAYDAAHETAYVHFEDRNCVVPVGATVYLRQNPAIGSGFRGSWRVVESARGCANLQIAETGNPGAVRVGDQVDLGPPPVQIAPISFNSQY